MKRKLSFLLSAIMAANVAAYAGSEIYMSYADYSAEAVSKLSNKSVKKEEILPSIIKPGVPEKVYLDIDSYSSAIGKISKDLNTDIKLPALIELNRGEVKGKLAKGVGVTLYKITKEESSSKRFTPDSSNLLSDNKFSILSENGDFNIKFNNKGLKVGENIGICISYSLREADNKIVNKTFVIEGTLIEAVPQIVGLNATVDVSKMVSGIPSGAKIEPMEKINTSVAGKKEIKLNIRYNNSTTQISVPVTISKKEAISPSETLRISGSNRYETNLESIKRSFKAGETDTAIVASGVSFADPLSAGPLAMKLKAPIFFSSKNGVSKEDKVLMDSLGIKKVIIIGGKNTVPEITERQLSGKRIRRIAGENRYATSEMIAKEFGTSGHIIITDGRKFADALSATPLAKKISAPIVLVGNVDNIPENISKYKDAYIVGGKNSVNEAIENSMKASMKTKPVYRIYGQNRIETSVQVAKLTKFNENIIANGRSFPDALSSINLINTGGKNLLLSGKENAPKSVMDLADGKVNYIIGGYATLSKNILGY